MAEPQPADDRAGAGRQTPAARGRRRRQRNTSAANARQADLLSGRPQMPIAIRRDGNAAIAGMCRGVADALAAGRPRELRRLGRAAMSVKSTFPPGSAPARNAR